MEKIAYKLYDNLKKCKKTIRNVTVKYPNNQLALKLFGTFLLEVYNDSIKGNELLSKAEHEKKQQEARSYEKFNYFDDKNGIIIISGDIENIGNISSINQQASDILKTSLNLAISVNIATFIPPPMNIPRAHNKYLLRYLINAESTTIPMPPLSYLVDSLGFLIEVYLQIRCVALNNSPFFLVGIKKTNLQREMILFESDTIIANSKGFSMLVGFGDDHASLKGYQIDAVIKGFQDFVKNENKTEVFQYINPKNFNVISLIFFDLNFKGVVFHYLIASDNPEEIFRWTNVANDDHDRDISEIKIINNTVISKLEKKKGILKLGPTVKKNKNIKFTDEPTYFYIDECDFKPGKSLIGKVKDASVIKTKPKPKEDPLIVTAKELDDNNKTNEIIDLKDLEVGFLRNADKQEKNNDDDDEEDEFRSKKSGASVASSAQSSNASFISSPEAQTLLNSVTNSMKSFKIAFCLTVTLM